MIVQTELRIATQPKSTHDVTASVQSAVSDSGIIVGLAHVFCMHTSASLMLCENADPAVRTDLEDFMRQLVPETGGSYEHSAEGPDDMPAHIRTVLMHTDLTLSVSDGRCDLGTWQGVYLWEHRDHPHHRILKITIHGDSAE